MIYIYIFYFFVPFFFLSFHPALVSHHFSSFLPSAPFRGHNEVKLVKVLGYSMRACMCAHARERVSLILYIQINNNRIIKHNGIFSRHAHTYTPFITIFACIYTYIMYDIQNARTTVIHQRQVSGSGTIVGGGWPRNAAHNSFSWRRVPLSHYDMIGVKKIKAPAYIVLIIVPTTTKTTDPVSFPLTHISHAGLMFLYTLVYICIVV